MVAKQQIAKKYSLEQLHLISNQLAEWQTEANKAVDQAQQLGEESIYVFNASSLAKGMTALTAFFSELAKSSTALLVGEPINAQTRKTRSKSPLNYADLETRNVDKKH